VLGEHHVNIEGQVLSTRGRYGYLVTDIAGPCTDDIAGRLRALPQTVRLRVLD
jgi:D-3-phosphoglycerate dehydrogenase / 2-oxoglutarate reductase